MTDLRDLLSRAGVSLPWSYRPCKYDDWGYIRGPEKISDLIGPYHPIVCNSRQSDVTEEQMAEHRAAKTDPYEPVGNLIVAAVNALPNLLSELDGARERIGELEAALEPFARASCRAHPNHRTAFVYVEDLRLAARALGEKKS